VPTIDKKIEAHLLGLGVGFLPAHRVKYELESGQLNTLELEEVDNRNSKLSMAWRKDNHGKALAWIVSNIQEPAVKLF
jgi:DNA-binding transcriptional LysR family regulator